MRVSKRILIGRHGDANYEAAFASEALTEKGIIQARTLGSQVREIVGEDAVRVISSDAMRAVATAELVCDEIGFPLDRIRIEPALSNYRVLDRAKRDSVFFHHMIDVQKRVKDLHELDKLYMAGDPSWENYPSYFEPRRSVANRVFRWLGQQVQSFHDEGECDLLVAITHAEVLNLILPAFGVSEPARQCELLDLLIDICTTPGAVTITSQFRDERTSREFQVPSRAFGAQFGPWWPNGR